MIESCMMLGLLGITSMEDLREHRLRLIVLYVGALAGIISHFFTRQKTIYELMGGMLIGLSLLPISYVSREQIGKGDALILMVTGIFLGFSKNLELFFSSMVLMSGWALLLLTIGKKDKKTQIPYVPFLLIAYVGMLAL